MMRTTTFYALLLLCVIALNTANRALLLPEVYFTNIQTAVSDQINGTDSLTANVGVQLNYGKWKPPKHSFIDYSTFLSPTIQLHSYQPYVSRLQPYEPYQAQPMVYLEIVVPPDHA